MTVTARTPVSLPVNPGALAERVDAQLDKHGRHLTSAAVMLVGAAPDWPYDPVLTTRGGRHVRVVPCVSVLAIWEQLSLDDELPRVLLTELGEAELGTGLLSRVFRRRVLDMEPWGLVTECFGVQMLDRRLMAEQWAGPALIDAMPSGGWPRLAGTVLHRGVALRHLAAQRLRLAESGIGPDDIDAVTLLRWSAAGGVPTSFQALDAAERAGLLAWLAEEFGAPARVLGTLVASGHGGDALPLGLVCESVWATTDPDALRAQGRIEQYVGDTRLDAATVRSYGEAATQAAVALLRAASGRDAETRTARHISHQVLDRAEDLLDGFAAGAAGRRSRTLRSGFTHRLGEVARHLRGALRGAQVDRTSLAPAAEAAEALAAHHLALVYPHRVERAQMAVRLVRWLATGTPPPASVTDGIERQVADWSWVDLALDHVWSGEDGHPDLAAVYRSAYERVRDRRRELDRGFAERLALWTSDGGSGEVLRVETILSRVVAPVVRDGRRPVLLLVIDGMTAAVAADLAEDITGQGWDEYDPVADRSPAAPARRRGAVAALPTVTWASRASLLAGALRRGDQDSERAAFAAHPLWRGRAALLFHQRAVHGEAGEVLSEELVHALSDPDTIVGVVINIVDDSLEHGREAADVGWRVHHLGPVRALLDHARYLGRAVILTSDHGHVPERDGRMLPAATAESGRHRTDPAPAGEGEVELVGPRVVTDDHRVVALWDPQPRYLPRRAGYHGGASLAEVTVPVLGLLPLGADPPTGWRALGPQPPPWWSPAQDGQPPVVAAPPGRARPSRRPPALASEALFALPEPVRPSPVSLVDQVLDSEMFTAQHALTPRKVALPKIRGALTALVEANGVLPAVTLAERAGEHPTRARGFVVTLQHIFNVDNYPVVSLADEGRTVRLELSLLRQQFDVGGSGR